MSAGSSIATEAAAAAEDFYLDSPGARSAASVRVTAEQKTVVQFKEKNTRTPPNAFSLFQFVCLRSTSELNALSRNILSHLARPIARTFCSDLSLSHEER